MVEGHTEVSRWFLETQANEHSREINRQNGERTRLQGASPEKRMEDMDRMGIDIQAISPAPRQTYYGADPDLGLARLRARSTISSPRSAAAIPTALSASARCRFRPPIWPWPSSTACTNHWAFAASRS